MPRSPIAPGSRVTRSSGWRTAAALLLVLAVEFTWGPAGVSVGGTPSPSPGAPGTSVASPGSPPSAEPSPEATRRPRPAQTLPPLEPLPRLDPAAARPLLAREVIAYLPYWVVNGSFQGARPFDATSDPWIVDERITDLVLFSVGVRRDGSLKLDEVNARFVLSGAATRIIRAAHARGIRVLVSFVSGGYGNNDALFRDETAPTRFVREAAALVALRGLDGADMDVELIRKRRFAVYARTAGLLKRTLQATDPDARVTVATNGNKSGATMAAMALSAGVDRAFLMGYAYRGRSSSPVGSISPLDNPTGLDLLQSLDMYQARGIDLGRVVLGLPTYGMTWPTRGAEPNAERAPSGRHGAGVVTSFYRAFTRRQPFGAVTDEVPSDPSTRIRWWDHEAGTWWQTYVDTPATMRPKLLTALERDLAGIGIWTLGYDGGLPGYADLMGSVLARPVVADASVDPPSGTGLDVRIEVEVLDVLAPTRSIQLSNDGVRWSPPVGPAAARDLRWRLATGEDGPRTVLVRSRDTDGRLSDPYPVTAVVDRTGPAIEGPSLREVPGGWRIGFAVQDLTGVERVRVRDRIDGGAWSAWRRIRTAADTWVAAPDGVAASMEVEAVDVLGNRSTATVTRGGPDAP